MLSVTDMGSFTVQAFIHNRIELTHSMSTVLYGRLALMGIETDDQAIE